MRIAAYIADSFRALTSPSPYIPMRHDDDDDVELLPPGAAARRRRPLLQRMQRALRRAFAFAFAARKEAGPRRISIGQPHAAFARNVTRNQKYRAATFLPQVIVEQFKTFSNLYFLLVALSQLIPALKVGFLFTYIAPLVFVLTITVVKEGYDDFQRYKRDAAANSQMYRVLSPSGVVALPSGRLQCGHVVLLAANDRVPADMLLLRTPEKAGAVFIRTDQLDGETDWKLKHAPSLTQSLPTDKHLLSGNLSLQAEAPSLEIYKFSGLLNCGCSSTSDSNFGTSCVADPDIDGGFGLGIQGDEQESLSIENMLWCNTVLCSSAAVGCVVYTGADTRAAMNTSLPSVKTGACEDEINASAKLLFVMSMVLSAVMTALKGGGGTWVETLFRFVILFSSIIPISLRVNMDMSKTFHSLVIGKDSAISGTVVRNSSIPEELGRISYLLTDKTGTLTQNDMVLKKIHLGDAVFSSDSTAGAGSGASGIADVRRLVASEASNLNSKAQASNSQSSPSHTMSSNRERSAGTTGGGVAAVGSRSSIATRVHSLILALALCHSVTPSQSSDGAVEYQASSPDEIALVKYAEACGAQLVQRDAQSITVRICGSDRTFIILAAFPFSSETKRMGIVLKCSTTGTITFYVKGADAVMSRIVRYSEWLEEECGNLSREGLRTLVIGSRVLTEKQYETFAAALRQAKATLHDRQANVQTVADTLEEDVALLGVTGVDDRLQEGVRQCLETLRNAGVRVWMLTGDKIETATCIARSARLVDRMQPVFTFVASSKDDAADQLMRYRRRRNQPLVIEG